VSSSCRFAAVVSLLLVSAAAVAAPHYPAVSYDTRGVDAATVSALQRAVGDGFWLETGDALFVAASAKTHAALARRASPVATHGDVALDELVLVPIGCDHRHDHGVYDQATVMPVALAVIGHYALIALPPAVAKGWPGGLPVSANSVLAREYRDGAAKGGADPALQQAADLVDTARWFQRVTDLAGFDRSTWGTVDSGNPDYAHQLGGARDWIRARFEALGIPTHLENFNIDIVPPTPSQRQNVVAVLPGLALPDEWVLVGGHYDSRNQLMNSTDPGAVNNTPGAEDNGSGCAGVIEMAEVFTRLRPDRTMLFVCYSGEEQGLRGSNSHVMSLVNSGDIARLKLAVIMDMIGYSGDSDLDLLLESGASQTALLSEFATLAATYAPGSRTVMSTSPCCSDHMGYINRGVPALLTIENDWNVYPHYHKTTDVPANMTNAQAMAGKILRTNAAALARYGIVTPRLFFDGFEDAVGGAALQRDMASCGSPGQPRVRCPPWRTTW
jgi:Zn-dependent M28 family amino/carboxypeptidase